MAPSTSDPQEGFSTYFRVTGRFLSRKDDVQLLVLELRTFWFVRNKKTPILSVFWFLSDDGSDVPSRRLLEPNLSGTVCTRV